jgi:hypothetical protein
LSFSVHVCTVCTSFLYFAEFSEVNRWTRPVLFEAKLLRLMWNIDRGNSGFGRVGTTQHPPARNWPVALGPSLGPS